jgi:hypothetical protein
MIRLRDSVEQLARATVTRVTASGLQSLNMDGDILYLHGLRRAWQLGRVETQITFENDKQEQATAKANAGILRCAQNDKRGQDKYRGPFNAFGMTAVLSYLTG